MFADPIGPWRPWFAWRPVKSFDGVWLWLRKVGRRRCQNHDYLSGPAMLQQWWQYAPFADIADGCRSQVAHQEGI